MESWLEISKRRIVDEVDALEAGVGERSDEHLHRDAVADRDRERVAAQRLGVGDPLGQRLGIGADDQIVGSGGGAGGRGFALAPGGGLCGGAVRGGAGGSGVAGGSGTPGGEAAEGVHRGRAPHHPLRILGPVGGRALVGRREEEHALLVQQVVEVVDQVGRGVAVLGHEQVDASRAGDGGGGVERQRAADQILEPDGRKALAVGAAQRLEGLRSGDQLRQLFSDGGHVSTVGRKG